MGRDGKELRGTGLALRLDRSTERWAKDIKIMGSHT